MQVSSLIHHVESKVKRKTQGTEKRKLFTLQIHVHTESLSFQHPWCTRSLSYVRDLDSSLFKKCIRHLHCTGRITSNSIIHASMPKATRKIIIVISGDKHAHPAQINKQACFMHFVIYVSPGVSCNSHVIHSVT